MKEKTIINLQKDISIIGVAANLFGLHLIQAPRGYIQTQEYEDLLFDMSKNQFIWPGQGKRGGVIEFISLYSGISYASSAEKLLDYSRHNHQKVYIYEQGEVLETEGLWIPARDDSVQAIRSFLQDSCNLSSETVSKLIDDYRVYQDIEKNCVFVEYDQNNHPISAYRYRIKENQKSFCAGSRRTGFYFGKDTGSLFIGNDVITTLKAAANLPPEYDVLCCPEGNVIEALDQRLSKGLQLHTMKTNDIAMEDQLKTYMQKTGKMIQIECFVHGDMQHNTPAEDREM